MSKGKSGVLIGCPLLLQLWIHESFDIGRPKADLSWYDPRLDDVDPADHSVVPPEAKSH
jgi:hypothetical protein